MTTLYWRRQCALDCPPLNTPGQDILSHSKMSRPVSQAHSQAIVRQHNGSRSVSLLRVPAGPATVARLVVAVIVDTIDLVIHRAWSHVREEAREVVGPFRTYDDVSPAIVLKTLALWIGAPLFHVFPGDVFAGALAMPASAMRQTAGSALLGIQASATLCASAPEIVGDDKRSHAALAPTAPQRLAGLTGSPVGLCLDRQATEHFSDKIMSVVSDAWHSHILPCGHGEWRAYAEHGLGVVA